MRTSVAPMAESGRGRGPHRHDGPSFGASDDLSLLGSGGSGPSGELGPGYDVPPPVHVLSVPRSGPDRSLSRPSLAGLPRCGDRLDLIWRVVPKKTPPGCVSREALVVRWCARISCLSEPGCCPRSGGRANSPSKRCCH